MLSDHMCRTYRAIFANTAFSRVPDQFTRYDSKIG